MRRMGINDALVSRYYEHNKELVITWRHVIGIPNGTIHVGLSIDAIKVNPQAFFRDGSWYNCMVPTDLKEMATKGIVPVEYLMFYCITIIDKPAKRLGLWY